MNKSLLACGVSILAIGVSHRTLAQEQRSRHAVDAGQTLEEIVVTAEKRSENIQDVPLSISALSGEQLAKGEFHNLVDVQQLIPSVNISPRLSSGVVAIRGIGFDILTAGAESSVAIHTDGVYASRPVQALAGLFDVERLEVARGPQGTIYGRNATGGAINIITRKPTAELEGYLHLTAGNYDAIAVEGAISGPLGDTLRARIAVKSDERSGYGTNLFNGRDIDDLSTRAIRAQLEFSPSETLSLLLTGSYFEEDDAAGAAHPAGCVTQVCNANAGFNRGGSIAPHIRDVNQDLQTVNEHVFKDVALTATVDLRFAELTSITGYRDGHNFFNEDFDETSLLGTFLTREEDSEEFSQELRLGGSSDRIDWLVGAYYFRERNNARANAAFPPFLAPTFTQFFQGGVLTTDAYAGFGQLTYRITGKLGLTVGARYSSERKLIEDEFTFTRGPANQTSRAAAPTPGDPCVVCRGLPDTVSFSSLTPKFGAEYHFTDERMFYVSAQKGFKSGSFVVGTVVPAFDPEFIWNYEAGLKASWFDRQMITNISAFHYDYTDLQTGTVVGTAVVVNNAAAAKVDGVEFETKAILSDRFSIDAHASWIDSRFTDFLTVNPAVGPAVLDLSGNALSNSPEWTGHIGADYVIPAFAGEITLRGEIFGSSRVYFSPFNDRLNSEKSYAMENLSVRYDDGAGNWFIGAFVKNLSDETIKAGSVVPSGLVGSVINVQLLPPRTFGLKVGYNF